MILSIQNTYPKGKGEEFLIFSRMAKKLKLIIPDS